MGRKPKIQVRVERDTKDAIDAYVSDNEDMGEPEAIRSLIRAGLAQKDYPVAAADGGTPIEKIASPQTMQLAGSIMLVGVASFAGATMVPTVAATVALVAVGAVLLAAGSAAVVAAALAQIALAKPVRGLLGAGLGVDD